jgi:hypothetical protein
MVELSTLFNITDLIYMKTSASSRLIILCVMFQIITLRPFIDILLTCGNNLHDRFILLRGKIGPHNSLAPPRLLK